MNTTTTTTTVDPPPGLIAAIMAQLRSAAQQDDKPFDEGDVFLMLCFRTDSELRQIAKLAGVL